MLHRLAPLFKALSANDLVSSALVDPYTYDVPNTNTSVKFSNYGGRLSGPNDTICIDNAYNHARHYPAQKLLQYYYVWYPSGNVALSFTPQAGKGMTYGMFVEMTRALRWFVVQQGMNVEVKYEVYEDFVGVDHVLLGKGDIGFWNGKSRPTWCPQGSTPCLLANTPGTADS